SQSSTHNGDGTWQWLTITGKLFSGSATYCEVRCQVGTSDGNASFWGMTLVEGPTAPPTNSPNFWRGRKTIMDFCTHGAATLAQSAPGSLGIGSSAAETDVSRTVPYKGVARKLRSETSTGVAAGQTSIATFRTAEATDSALTATITGTARTASDL